MSFEKAAEFHGHKCPGLAIGYRVAMIADEMLGERSEDEEFVAIVENNSCSVDAIQAINGCTFGKGNLVFRDLGKHVYTLFKRGDRNAVRISLRPMSDPGDERQRELFKKIRTSNATKEEIEEFGKVREEAIRRILERPQDDLFEIKEIQTQPPVRARIYRTIICDSCGEGVMEAKARIVDGKFLCIPCFDKVNS